LDIDKLKGELERLNQQYLAMADLQKAIEQAKEFKEKIEDSKVLI
jgi:hypothetical protein